MIHIYKDKGSNKTLIMLHGTGGNEHQMIPLAERIDPTANILSIRGNINENGMNRYFRRFKMGSYDIENYLHETDILINTILNLSKEYNFHLENTTAIGFSNGANIALGVIQTNPVVKNYILLSPDYINKDRDFNNLDNKNIFISTADNDPYVNNLNMETLIMRLTNQNSNLKVIKTSGHEINNVVLSELIKWYNNI